MTQIGINEICKAELEQFDGLGKDMLKTIHSIAKKVAEEYDLELMEMIRLEHELLMRFVAMLLEAHVTTVNKALDELNRVIMRDDYQYEVM